MLFSFIESQSELNDVLREMKKKIFIVKEKKY